MKDTVTLKELAAVVIRRGKQMIILALVFALALGGFKLSQWHSKINAPENTDEQIEERYQQAVETYTLQKEQLDLNLQELEKQLHSEQEYKESSMLMGIDPYDKAVTLMNIAITDIEESAFLQVYQIEGTPVDFIVSRIQNQYLVLWRGVDLQKELGGEVSDKFIREVAGVSAESGGLLEIIAYGATKEESKALAYRVYDFLVENSNVVAESAYPHAFVLLSESTKAIVDTDLEASQKSVVDNITSYLEQIENVKNQLDELAAPAKDAKLTYSDAVGSVAKFVVLGVVTGVFAGALWAIVCFLFSSKVDFSYQLEGSLQVPLMGCITEKKNIWNAIADRLAGERVWPEEEDALNYLEESARIRLGKGEKVVLLTTLREDENNPAIRMVADRLQHSGYMVSVVGNACYNPKVLAAIAQSESVILMERCGCSTKEAIDTVAALAQEQSKPIKGYVLI